MPSIRDFASSLNMRTGSTEIALSHPEIEAFITEWDDKFHLIPKAQNGSFASMDASCIVTEKYLEIRVENDDGQSKYSEFIYFDELTLRDFGFIAAAWGSAYTYLIDNYPKRFDVQKNESAIEDALRTGDTSMPEGEPLRLAKALHSLGYKIVKE